MIRITRLPKIESKVRLMAEGQLTHTTADQIRQACVQSLAEGKPVELDVAGIVFADHAGIDLLRELQIKGAVLTGCTGFLEASLLKDDEGDVIQRLKMGEARAFEELVRTHGGRMLATARRFFNSESDAEDAVQEAFLSAFRAISGFAGGCALATWLHRIVVNAALMQLRTRRRRREQGIADLLPRFDEQGEWGGAGEYCVLSSEADYERAEVREMVRDCIAELPEKYRAVLLLRDIAEMDATEVAAVLNLNSNTVKVRLHRARQALRTLIARRTEMERIDVPCASPTERRCA